MEGIWDTQQHAQAVTGQVGRNGGLVEMRGKADGQTTYTMRQPTRK